VVPTVLAQIPTQLLVLVFLLALLTVLGEAGVHSAPALSLVELEQQFKQEILLVHSMEALTVLVQNPTQPLVFLHSAQLIALEIGLNGPLAVV